jgi:GNAT superfamily N-acetyltransferase
VIRPFAEGHLADASRLLARRHLRHRVTQPLLDERYERPDMAAEEVAALWDIDGASGAVALLDDQLIGFVLGVPKADKTWGANVWVEGAGHALSDGCDAELTRDLYGAAAQTWVDQGLTAHYVLVPSDDETVVDAWFRCGFGQQHVHALRPVPDGEELADLRAALDRSPATIRSAGEGDVAALAALDLVLDSHQLMAPVFSKLPPMSLEEAVADWADGIHDDTLTTYVAERDGDVIGSAIGCSITKSSTNRGILRPPDAGFLGFAAVQPDGRGLGIGRALGQRVLAWSAEQGYRSVATDWRATNLLSSRAWPRLGFEPTFLRLHRQIG